MKCYDCKWLLWGYENKTGKDKCVKRTDISHSENCKDYMPIDTEDEKI
jgi:hypothetical protein